ncbi:hypothetical protein SUVZ_09G1070 [Saccharomyces uvarum]|uniref:Uncharacterized protein n=1 Tax=Saccharomyces uvarum TaxID=230603 RepID=A0ABN8WY27_SACUV|nr:hypothetical protein SUVZ_09G1070 [Saccharomyces uvarum]
MGLLANTSQGQKMNKTKKKQCLSPRHGMAWPHGFVCPGSWALPRHAPALRQTEISAIFPAYTRPRAPGKLRRVIVRFSCGIIIILTITATPGIIKIILHG